MYKKALKWKESRKAALRLSTDLRLTRHESDGFLQLAEWLDRGEMATLALQHFIDDFNINHATPPPDCCISVLDLLCLRQGVMLNNAVITAALASLCTPIPGATTYPIASYNVTGTLTKQLTRAIHAQQTKVVLCV